MKKHLLLFIVLIVIVGLSRAQFNAEKTPLITQSLANDNIKSVLAETSGGSITVVGVSANEARLEVFVVPNNYRENNLSESEIRQRMKDNYTVKFWSANNKLTATAKPNDPRMDWRKALNFSYKIYVPVNATTDLSTSGGSISLSNLSGDQDFSTSGGSLHVDGLSGKTHGKTSGGSIEVENSKNDIDLSTSGGSIDARNCEGKIRLNTSGGSLSLRDLKGDIRAETSGGSINGKNISGELNTHTSGGSIHLIDLYCSLETSTSGGNIDVSMKELGKYVKINNSGGNIDLELPKDKGMDLDLSAGKIKTGHLENFSGKMEEDTVNGKLNGGGVKVSVDAGGGKITLELK